MWTSNQTLVYVHHLSGHQFHEIWQVKLTLEKEGSDVGSSIHDMVKYMQNKFKKYWKVSWLALSIPVILDPRFKFAFLEFRFESFGDQAEAKLAEVMVFQGLFNEYSQLDDCNSESAK